VLAFDKMRGGAEIIEGELVQEPMKTRSTGISMMGVPAFQPIYFSALSVAF